MQTGAGRRGLWAHPQSWDFAGRGEQSRACSAQLFRQPTLFLLLAVPVLLPLPQLLLQGVQLQRSASLGPRHFLCSQPGVWLQTPPKPLKSWASPLPWASMTKLGEAVASVGDGKIITRHLLQAPRPSLPISNT